MRFDTVGFYFRAAWILQSCVDPSALDPQPKGHSQHWHRPTILEAHPWSSIRWASLPASSCTPRSALPPRAQRSQINGHTSTRHKNMPGIRPCTRFDAAFRRSPPDLCGSAFCLCEKASRAASGTAALPVTLPSLLPLLHTLICHLSPSLLSLSASRHSGLSLFFLSLFFFSLCALPSRSTICRC